MLLIFFLMLDATSLNSESWVIGCSVVTRLTAYNSLCSCSPTVLIIVRLLSHLSEPPCPVWPLTSTGLSVYGSQVCWRLVWGLQWGWWLILLMLATPPREALLPDICYYKWLFSLEQRNFLNYNLVWSYNWVNRDKLLFSCLIKPCLTYYYLAKCSLLSPDWRKKIWWLFVICHTFQGAEESQCPS